MVRLREIPRTACFAWSPGPTQPLIATGTKAGAVDADFSNETQLELWELKLDDSEQGVELKPVATVSVESRFNDIAWSQPSEQYPRGIIAGALDSGALVLWDAEKLQAGEGDDAEIDQIDKHTGPIQAIQFNPFRSNILASAGAKGELYVHDLADDSKSFRLGKAGANPDEYTTLDWNKKVAHILATGSSGGFVTVWDVKLKKENLTLNHYGRKTVSAVSWDPNVPTRLVTAIPTDQNPLVLVWDLRNTNAPEKTLQAHDQGVLSLSWCVQDSDLLLSCGKDNRTIAWNPHTGEQLGEFPVVTNWTFQTRFNPSNPNLLATASFDGKIAVQTLQNTGAGADQNKAATEAPAGEDFFAQTHAEPQGASFSLKTPPKWLKRRAGVAFGFGGKLVRFGIVDNKSKISISTFAVDSDVSAASEEFDKALDKGDITAICESKISKAANEEEKADWTVIETLTSENPRSKLVEYLGFSDKDEEPEEEKKEEKTNGDADEGSSFFDNATDEGNFLSDLAASKGAKTNNPFQIYTGSESEADTKITRNLMLGDFNAALDVCLKENRLSDAFMIAICGGEKCIAKAQAAYFKRQSDAPNYLRLLASVVGKNLWDFVYNADLKDWKEVMATICTFADQADFPDLCEALGDRLEEAISEEEGTYRKDASFCYLAGSKLEKVVVNWAQELQESEKAGIEQTDGDNSFSIHARSLQEFIEKVTVFRKVTNFKDAEQQKEDDWKLEPLYAKYVEYADIASAHGQLAIAEKYLDLLPQKYPAADVARNRVKQATRKVAAQPAAAQKQAQSTTAGRRQVVVPSYGQPAQATPAPPQQTPYAPVNPMQTQPRASPYAPVNPLSSQAQPTGPSTFTPAAAPGNSYTPVGYQPSQPQGYGYNAAPQQGIAPPPRNFSNSPSIVPAANRGSIPAWNDTPDFGPPKPASRRGTPMNTVASPFPNQQQPLAGPPQGPFSPGARSTPPPPPKGPPQGPPRMTSPPSGPPTGAPNPYAPAPASNNYAAPPAGFAPPQQAPVQRGASPYQPPTAAAPPSNRYAPAPGSQPSAPPGPMGGMPPPRNIAPPPGQFTPVGSAYAPSPVQQMPTAAAAPPPRGPPQGPPRAGPPPGGPPGGPQGGPPRPDSRPGTGQSQAAAQAAPKYPPGDRSHIPDASRPIYEILDADLQRVKAKAPAQYKQHVADTEKRLNILFDHLNNEDLLKPDTIQQMNELAAQIQAKQYDAAVAIFSDLMTNKTDEGSNWMVGVKRLIQFSKSTA
ncbi:protein transport protein S31 [Alternaria novae-zelandiae]|uniref:protein transport protein S31 n=1 Tax=Alternaria novae-zelandiae TaxID=430562 RepID=UPI0020C1F6CE|nr:protein transport protein S31 [Alternaria novae-zelandiae]KAI4675170.1 protein transport protein S31 [Alternaria novae-zelandiae]